MPDFLTDVSLTLIFLLGLSEAVFRDSESSTASLPPQWLRESSPVSAEGLKLSFCLAEAEQTFA
jgi:hypothetical protein